MQSVRADLALLGLAVVGVCAELACVLTGHPAPGLFEQVTIAGLAGGAGVALPSRTSTPDPAPAPAPVTPAAPAYTLAPSGPVAPVQVVR